MSKRKDIELEALEERLRRNPASLIFPRLADVYREKGELEQAVNLCTYGLKIHPYSDTGRIILGKCFLQQEKFDEGIRELVKVLQSDPRNQASIKMLADAFARQGAAEKAGDLYACLAALDPENKPAARLSAVFPGTGKKNIRDLLGLAPSSNAEPPARRAIAVENTIAGAEVIELGEPAGFPSPMVHEILGDHAGPLSAAGADSADNGPSVSANGVDQSCPEVPPNPPPEESVDAAVPAQSDSPDSFEEPVAAAVAADTPASPEVPTEASLPEKKDTIVLPGPHYASMEIETVPDASSFAEVEEQKQCYSIPDHVLTPTLADIYLEQGQSRLAARIYARLLQRDPGNQALAARLATIEKAILSDAQNVSHGHAAAQDQKGSGAQKAQSRSARSFNAAKPLSGIRIKKEIRARFKGKA